MIYELKEGIKKSWDDTDTFKTCLVNAEEV